MTVLPPGCSSSVERPSAADPAPRSWAVVARRALSGLLLALVVVYAPMAVEFSARFYSDDAPRLWDHALSAVAGSEFEGGPVSASTLQTEAYRQERVWITMHTTTAGLALLLGIWQFSGRLRSARPGLHRRLGKAYVVSVVISMGGSAAFLLSAAKQNVDIYSGPPFLAGLWGLWALTLLALLGGVRAIRAGDVRRHSEFMALSYACLLTAPMLRVGWSVIGASSSIDQWDANLAYATSLVPQTVLLAAIWRSFRSGAAPVFFGTTMLPGRTVPVIRGLSVIGVVAAINYTTLRLGDPRFAPPSALPEWDHAGAAVLFFMGYSVGAVGALLLGLAMISAVQRMGAAALHSPPVRHYLVAVALAVAGLFGFVFATGDATPGGIAAVYYWTSVALFWLFTTCVLLRSMRRGDHNRSVEWAVHSVAMTLQTAWFHVVYLALGTAGFADPVNRLITAGTLAFAVSIALGYGLVTQFGGPPSGRRTASPRAAESVG